MKTSISVALGVGLASLLLAGAEASAADYRWALPSWAPEPNVPADNPMNAAKVELGRRLFYDKRLSGDETMACATCHDQSKAFTDGKAVAKGITDEAGARSSMTLANVAYLPVYTWANPNIDSLEKQALVPMFGTNPIELGLEGKEQVLFDRLQNDADYPAMFRAAFPEVDGAVSLSTVTKAIAAFERSLMSFSSPYDRYKYGGEADAISEQAKRGENLFFGERLECHHCHGGLNFTDNIAHQRMPFSETGFHNTGLYNIDGKGAYPQDNPGIRAVTGDAADEGKFRTPSLRNIALTAPYMHDGSLATLRDVIVHHYAVQGKAVYDGRDASPLRSSLVAGFEVSDRDVADLIAFLETLSDKEFTSNPDFRDPFTQKASESASVQGSR